jgi:hypothetical protein
MDYFTRQVVFSSKGDLGEEDGGNKDQSKRILTITDCFGFIEQSLDIDNPKHRLVPPEEGQERLTE